MHNMEEINASYSTFSSSFPSLPKLLTVLTRYQVIFSKYFKLFRKVPGNLVNHFDKMRQIMDLFSVSVQLKSREVIVAKSVSVDKESDNELVRKLFLAVGLSKQFFIWNWILIRRSLTLPSVARENFYKLRSTTNTFAFSLVVCEQKLSCQEIRIERFRPIICKHLCSPSSPSNFWLREKFRAIRQ